MIEIDEIIEFNEDNPSTLDITEPNSSFNQSINDLSEFNLKIEKFKRSLKSSNSIKLTQLLDESFKLNIVDMNDDDDNDFYDGRILVNDFENEAIDNYESPEIFPLTLESFNDYNDFISKDISFINSPNSYRYPVEKGLRLLSSSIITMENSDSASVEETNEKKKINETKEQFELRRIREKTINHGDFQNFDEGDLFEMFKQPSPIIKEPPKIESNFMRKSSNQTTFIKHYDYETSDDSISAGLYSGASLLEMFANNIENDLTSTSANYVRKQYNDLQNKDDWINSLNSAFKINEDLTDELKKHEIVEIPSLSPSPELEEEITTKPPNTATSLFSLTNEKMVDLFQKFSAKIYSSTTAEDNKQDFKDEENVDLKDELVFEPFSPPGTITAKLFVENGLSVPSSVAPNEVIKSHFIENIEASSASKSTSTADFIPSNLIEEEEEAPIVDSWTLNNKFVRTPLKNDDNKRKRSIRKILFSAISKDSSTADSNSSKDTTNSRLSWSKSILRGKSSLHRSYSKLKKSSTKKFNMDSGQSLEEYAAEYAKQNDLLTTNNIKSKDSEIIEKIMENTRRSHSKEEIGSVKRYHTLPTRSISEYVPTPIPKTRSKSIFSKSNFGLNRKKELSIRFAPTPEYITETRRSRDSHHSILKKFIK